MKTQQVTLTLRFLLLILTSALVLCENTSAAPPLGPTDIRNSGAVVGEVQCEGLPAVGVLVQTPGYSFSAYTDEQGVYRLLYVPEGTYDLSMDAGGQGAIIMPAIQVLAGQVITAETVDICTVTPPPGGNDVSSGTYALTQSIEYTCSFQQTFPVVNVNIAEFVLQVSGTNLTVTGAPVLMTGTVNGPDFQASGIISGDVAEIYAINGSFTDADNWTGTFTITFVGDLTGTDCANQQFDIGAARIGGGNDASSGTYAITPNISYMCNFLGIPVVQVNIAEFVFQVIDTNLTATGAPVTMTGSVNGSNFAASGSIPGDVTETYAINGSFTTADDWIGTFTITFVGDLTGTTCSNQQFDIGGTRTP